MERNVWSFKTAIRKGYEPGLYVYDPKQIPLGEFEAVLDFKTWSKRIIAINCYFTKMDTKERFVVTVYGNNQTGRYEVPGSVINFSTCAVNATYRISVSKNKGRIILSKAESQILPVTK
jgi:hypothetical protein